jgi:hypothetical protein
MCFGSSSSQTITPTADMIANEQRAAGYWDWAQQNIIPVMNANAATVFAPENQKAESQQVAGQINAQVMQALPARGSDNPVANTAQVGKLGQVATAAQQRGQAATQSAQVSREQGAQGLYSGEPGQVVQGGSQLAQSSLNLEGVQKQLNMQTQAGWQDLMLGAAGTGAGYAAGNRQLSMGDAQTSGVPTTNVEPYDDSNPTGLPQWMNIMNQGI